jgi:hypothetical protein
MNEDQPELSPPPYEAPTLVLLGTLAELTQSGAAGIPDGFGGADGSFLPP